MISWITNIECHAHLFKSFFYKCVAYFNIMLISNTVVNQYWHLVKSFTAIFLIQIMFLNYIMLISTPGVNQYLVFYRKAGLLA